MPTRLNNLETLHGVTCRNSLYSLPPTKRLPIGASAPWGVFLERGVHCDRSSLAHLSG
ncbi:hypothetical protein LF1_33940 [Rubripirellula obstinata]|uniref:Uncharacterized protein n=1 Tax=Rubripirellula obstinata TaxID=406547 RepID=A0A5B1CKJ8_9BACT|nr:hypothetical protein LF1_33940 [Rubripirellula obstinata]